MRENADKLLVQIAQYLTENNWKIDNYTLYWIDPQTGTCHHTMTALNVQLDRDLAIKQKI